MDAETYRRARELFHAALAESPARRRAFLEARCSGQEELLAEVCSLLEHHESSPPSATSFPLGTDLPRAFNLDPFYLAPQQGPPLVLQEIGSYRILDVLGEGGMSIVYLARQKNPARK